MGAIGAVSWPVPQVIAEMGAIGAGSWPEPQVIAEMSAIGAVSWHSGRLGSLVGCASKHRLDEESVKAGERSDAPSRQRPHRPSRARWDEKADLLAAIQ